LFRSFIVIVFPKSLRSTYHPFIIIFHGTKREHDKGNILLCVWIIFNIFRLKRLKNKKIPENGCPRLHTGNDQAIYSKASCLGPPTLRKMENTFRARPVCFSLGLISLAKPVSKSIRLAVSGRSWTEFGQWAGWAGPKILSACSVLLAAAGGQRAVECKRPYENLRVYLFFFLLNLNM